MAKQLSFLDNGEIVEQDFEESLSASNENSSIDKKTESPAIDGATITLNIDDVYANPLQPRN